MLALPFDSEKIEHLVIVSDKELSNEDEFVRLARSIDRNRTRATVLSLGGECAKWPLVSGYGIEIEHYNRGILRKPFHKRVSQALRVLRSLKANRVEVITPVHAKTWQLAARLGRLPLVGVPAARPDAAKTKARALRDHRKVAIVLKSDLGRQSAHISQALNTARSLIERGAEVTIAGPLEDGAFDEIVAKAAAAGSGDALRKLDMVPIRKVKRSIKNVRRMQETLRELERRGCGTLYFRQVRIASMLLPMARERGFLTFMEAHQPYTTWALHQRRRVWRDHPEVLHDLRAQARFDRDFELRCYRELDGVIATTDAMVARVRRLAPATPALLLRNGAPDPAQFPNPLPQRERPLDLIYIGKAALEKGTDVLVDALPLLPGVRLLIVGGPTELDLAPFLTQAERLGVRDRVDTITWIAQSELFSHVGKAKVAIHPLAGRGSKEWRMYTCPLKLMEYMAVGTPVVGTDLPAIRELVEPDVNGVLAAPGDPKALAAAIRRLLGDPPFAERIAREAQRRIAQWSHEARADRLWRFIEETAAQVAR